MNYEDLLNRGIAQLPEVKELGERFNIPKVKGHIQGSKTIISNFLDITKTLERDGDHVLKFILRELATPGSITNNQLIFGRKVSSAEVNGAIQKYADSFVICKECGKPDTKVTKKAGISSLKCLACGAQNTIRSKI